jgi:hypothetical protein
VLATHRRDGCIELRGDARLLPADIETVRRIASRYFGNADSEAYAEGGGDDAVIRLEPGKLRAWDFADEFAA